MGLISESYIQYIIEKYGTSIKGLNDLTAGEDPSLLFYILATKLNYLLDNDPNNVLSEKGVNLRRKINPFIKKAGTYFLNGKQIIENRKFLLDNNSKENDKNIVLPDKPVIWISNHSFKDDILASILASYRHSYILLASLPQFYNTFDGITAWLNGTILMNRKVKESRGSVIPKVSKAIDLGVDVLIFSEGVWNKTPNELLINLWPGIYKMVQEKDVLVVPIVHYINDSTQKSKNNVIHTVIDNPIDISQMSEKEALTKLRDTLGTWYYLMMEKYGKCTREELLRGFSNSQDAWEHQLKERVSGVQRYDSEIELSADYRPKDIIRPEDVFAPIADITDITKENAGHVAYAKKLVKTMKMNDFQRRF